MSRLIERIWQRDGLGSLALTPLSWIFGAGVAARNAAYEAGLFRTHELGLPAVSVGNLSVGGTGKTPVSAWVASHYLRAGVRPAVLLRGYGADEPLVHAKLNPRAIVLANADRVSAARDARRKHAQVLVLDDAFQHRRARRDLDLLLVAAEQGRAHRLLPAGPLREGRGAVRRAGMLIVTRKTASLDQAGAVADRWSHKGSSVEVATAIIHLAAGPLELAVRRPAMPEAERTRALESLRGRRALAISAIGAPRAFEEQLRLAGGKVISAAFADHHAFTAADITNLARQAAGVDIVVCTLKDAVKLADRWPANAPPVWYLSQALTVERGEAILTDHLDRLVRADAP